MRKRLTKAEIDAITPILMKDRVAKKALALWLSGQSDVQATGPVVRRQVARMVADRDSKLRRNEREQLLVFAVAFPPGANASKAEDPLSERLQFRVSAEQKEMILRAAKLEGVKDGDWLRRVACVAAERTLGGHGGISGIEDAQVGG